jgi:hypothetical protein
MQPATLRAPSGTSSSPSGRIASAIEGPLYSRQTYDSESDARVSAWEALCALQKAFA